MPSCKSFDNSLILSVMLFSFPALNVMGKWYDILQRHESYFLLGKVFSDYTIFILCIFLANNRQLTFRFWKLPGIRRSLTPPAIMDSDPFSVTTVLCEVEPSAGHIYCCLRVHVLITCHGHSAPGKRICSLEAQYSAFIEKCAGKRFTSHLTLNPPDPKAVIIRSLLDP